MVIIIPKISYYFPHFCSAGSSLSLARGSFTFPGESLVQQTEHSTVLHLITISLSSLYLLYRPFQMRAWSCITSYPLRGLPYLADLAYDNVNPAVVNSMMLRSSMLAFEKGLLKIVHCILVETFVTGMIVLVLLIMSSISCFVCMLLFWCTILE